MKYKDNSDLYSKMSVQEVISSPSKKKGPRLARVAKEVLVAKEVSIIDEVPLLEPAAAHVVKRKGPRIAPKNDVDMKEKRTKATAKANEEADVSALIHMLNIADSDKGQEMRKAFETRFGQSIIGVTRHKTMTQAKQKKGGGRSTHYDFVIQLADGTERTVEHKGSHDKKPIDLSLPPWTGGVQFYNGGLEKYRFAQKYAKAWYEQFIASGVLSERYGLTSPIPTEEEWIAKDAKVQSLAKTPFGKELKKVYQERDGCEKGSLKTERDEFVQGFEWSEEDERQLAEDVFPLIQSSFAEKDVWLQIAGSVETGDFYFAWRDPIRIQRVERITIEKKKDIEFTVECDSGLVVHGILRWGYGAGFSNIRIDLK